MLIDCLSNKKITPYFVPLSREQIISLNINKQNGWNFNWQEPFWQGCIVYALFIASEPKIVQGLASFMIANESLELFSLETAVHNRYLFPNRFLKNVGKHLVAFGCKISSQVHSQALYPTHHLLSMYSKGNSRDFYRSLNAKEVVCDWWVIDRNTGLMIRQECTV